MSPLVSPADPMRDWLGIHIDGEDQLMCPREACGQFPHLEDVLVDSVLRTHFKSICGNGGFSSPSSLRRELTTSEPLFVHLAGRWNLAQDWLRRRSEDVDWSQENWMGDLAEDSASLVQQLAVWELTNEGRFWYAMALGGSVPRDARFVTEQFVLVDSSWGDEEGHLVPADEMFCAIQKADLSAESVLELVERFGLPSPIFFGRHEYEGFGRANVDGGTLYPLPLLQTHFALCKALAEFFIQGAGKFDRRPKMASLIQATFSGGKQSEAASALNFEPNEAMNLLCQLVNMGLAAFSPELYPIDVSSTFSEDGCPEEDWKEEIRRAGIRQRPTRQFPDEGQVGHDPFQILCADIHRMIIEGHQLRQCQDSQCNAWFTIHRGRSIKQNRARQDSVYCSTRCSNRVQQEKLRNRKR